MTTDAISPDPARELAALVGTAIVGTPDVDREVLHDIAVAAIRGSDRVAQRLGVALASAVLAALEATNRPARDPRAIAQAAFVAPKDAQG